MIRQGDVLLKKIDKPLIGLSKRKDKTVALGEATGHHHTFTGHAEVFGERSGQQCVVVEGDDCVLTHQEHKTIEIPKGIYEVMIQREFDLVEQLNKQVND